MFSRLQVSHIDANLQWLETNKENEARRSMISAAAQIASKWSFQ